jgi:hypothetical protein
MLKWRFQHLAYLLTTLIVLSVLLTGCTPPPQAPRLRITNQGSTAIKSLTILFPEDQIEFGDIPVGATTDYKEVPNGVYSYAAYRLWVHGQIVTIPTIDWVGEEPMEGSDFTYVLAVDPDRSLLAIVRLVNVIKDD